MSKRASEKIAEGLRETLSVARGQSDIERCAQDNIERIAWTLKDPEWRPSRTYVEKMLAAYRELLEYKKDEDD